MEDRKIFKKLVIVREKENKLDRIFLDPEESRIEVFTPGVKRGERTEQAWLHLEPRKITLDSNINNADEAGLTLIENAKITLDGTSGRSPELILKRSYPIADNRPVESKITLTDKELTLKFQDNIISFNAQSESIQLGASGKLELAGESANLSLGGGGKDGDILLHDEEGNLTIGFNGNSGNGIFGGNGKNGTIKLLSSSNTNTAELDGLSGQLLLKSEGAAAVKFIGMDAREMLVINAQNTSDWPTFDQEDPIEQLDLVLEVRKLKQKIIQLETALQAK